MEGGIAGMASRLFEIAVKWEEMRIEENISESILV